MITVAFLVHSLRAGGIERSVTRIVNGLDPTRFDPLIICLDQTGPAEKWLRREVPIVELKKRSGNDWWAVPRLAKTLRQHHVDLVQSHNWGTLLECTVARNLAGTPHHIHAERGTVLGSVTAGGWRHALRAQAMRIALRSVDRVISNADAVARRVEERCGYPAHRIEIVPNGVPPIDAAEQTPSRHQIRQSLGINEQALVIGSVGRLVHVKGFDLALQAFAQIQRQRPEVHFLLVGDGPEQEALLKASQRLGLEDRVHLVGRRDNVEPWLLAMDLYLNSSRSEGMSQSVVEAMSAGLPIVATDVGDNARLIARPDETCGLVCPPESADALATSIGLMLGDAEQRTRSGQKSLACHAQYYSESALIGAVEALYDAVILPTRKGDMSAMTVTARESSSCR